MTLFHEIEAECERLADCPDTAENAKLGITFRAVWWRQIRQELANQTGEIERLRAALIDIASLKVTGGAAANLAERVVYQQQAREKP